MQRRCKRRCKKGCREAGREDNEDNKQDNKQTIKKKGQKGKIKNGCKITWKKTRTRGTREPNSKTKRIGVDREHTGDRNNRLDNETNERKRRKKGNTRTIGIRNWTTRQIKRM